MPMAHSSARTKATPTANSNSNWRAADGAKTDTVDTAERASTSVRMPSDSRKLDIRITPLEMIEGRNQSTTAKENHVASSPASQGELPRK